MDGKKYVGRHMGSPDDPYTGSGKYFRRALRKYGRESFERTILEFVEEKEIKDREQFYLDYYDAASDPMFYNISPNSHGGHHGADYLGENNPMFGRRHPNHRPHWGNENGMFGSKRVLSANPNAKSAEIIAPDGRVFRTTCLKEWCISHSSEFGVGPSKVYQSLKEQAIKDRNRPALRGNCKGWNIRYVSF